MVFQEDNMDHGYYDIDHKQRDDRNKAVESIHAVGISICSSDGL